MGKVEKEGSKKSVWQRTQVQGLLRHRKSGRYYGRWKITVNGKPKQIWRKLETDVFSVAKERLNAEAAKVEKLRGSRVAVANGECVVGDLMAVDEQRTNAADLKSASKISRLIAVKKLRKTWPELKSLKPSQVTTNAVVDWVTRFKNEGTNFVPRGAKSAIRGNSATSVNRAVDALRRIMQLAVERGAIHANPVVMKTSDGRRLKKKIPRKKLTLPSMVDVQRLFLAMENNGARGGWGLEAADFCRFLCLSGCRVGEVPGVTWQCVNWDRKRLHVRGVEVGDDEESTLKTETSDRFVPLFPELQELLKKIIERRKRAAIYSESGKPMINPSDPVFRISECQKTIDAACKVTGVHRITHHDFRHLFATRLIEESVDVITVAAWLGHADGGVLAMKTYGHLRDEHSTSKAANMRFNALPDNREGAAFNLDDIAQTLKLPAGSAPTAILAALAAAVKATAAAPVSGDTPVSAGA